jgi:hypothetical protein
VADAPPFAGAAFEPFDELEPDPHATSATEIATPRASVPI